MKTSRPEISRASRASLTAALLIALDLVLEEVRGQLAAVGAERVGLDQVGAGVDEADVEGDDRLGSAEIGLFGQRRRGTAPVTSTPIPPSATTIGPVWRRSAKRSAMA